MKIAVALFATLLGLAAHGETQLAREFSAPVAAKGVFVMVHGLNLKPEKMFVLANVLTSAGYDVFNAALTGHRDGTDIRDVTAEVWQDEMASVFSLAQARAEKLGVPLYFLGYSVGGQQGLRVIQAKRLPVKKMILFAPAIAIRGQARLVELLKHFSNLMIPSLCPVDYRENRFTPVAAYNALFATLKDLLAGQWAALNVPTLLIVDRKDELVNLKKTEKLIAEKNLNAWHVMPVANAARYHHLIIDEPSLGSVEWQRVTAAMSELLQ